MGKLSIIIREINT